MSLVTDARSLADTAVEQGKQVLTQAQKRLSARADNTREQLDAALHQADAVRTDARHRLADGVETVTGAARRQALAVLGAGDVALGAFTRRVEQVPATASDVVRDLRTRGESLRARGEQAAGELGSFDAGQALDSTKQGAAAYVGLARSVYDGLTERGEHVVADLRRDPRLLRVLGATDRTVQQTADRVADSAGRVRRQAHTVSEQAAADERSVTATKAAATRKAQADKRSSAGRKAAATRKATATRKASAGTSTSAVKPAKAKKTATPTKATRKSARKSTSSR